MKSFLALMISTSIFSTICSFIPESAEAQYAQVQIKIERYTSVMGAVNVRSYIKNLAHYQGFRLVAVEVIASALNETSAMNVQINKTRQGPTLHLGSQTQIYRISPNTSFVMGRGAENIVLRTENPAYIKTVNLILAQ
jgi:hypothetical protein